MARWRFLIALGIMLTPFRAQAIECIYQAPLTITSGGTYIGCWKSDDPNTPAITINTTQPVTIAYSYIQSKGELIKALPGSDLTVTNTSLTGLNPGVPRLFNGRAIDAEGVARLTVWNNDFNNTAGIYVLTPAAGAPISVMFNTAENINGRMSTGTGYAKSDVGGFNPVQFVQFDKVTGPLAEVAWNQVLNDPYVSRVEDNISMFQSCGTAANPINIHDNFIRGGYPGAPDTDPYSGGGIIADGVSVCFVHAHDNQVIETTNYGVAIAGGHDNELDHNFIMGIGLLADGIIEPSQNVGGFITGSAAHDTIHDNTTGWTNAAGQNNKWFIVLACGVSCFFNNTPVTPSRAAEDDQFNNVWLEKLSDNNIIVGTPMAETPAR
jgi:hypothetical protein